MADRRVDGRKGNKHGRSCSRAGSKPIGGGGYDWGWPAVELATAGHELVRKLGAGGFVGCAYGMLSAGGPPFVALVGEKAEGMRSALEHMREWTDAVGPNAISVEILFDDPGYVISVGPQPDLLKLRLRGLDPDEDTILMGISLMKRLDTRHPFLDELARYSREPVAPVYLTIVDLPPGAGRGTAAFDAGAMPPFARDGILLPGIKVYARLEDRPIESAVRLESEMPTAAGRRFPPEPASDPGSIARRRERRLLATMPKTIHVLRHCTDGRALVDDCKLAGCTTWQVEQAVSNLRLEAELARLPRGASKRAALRDVLRGEMVEWASAIFDFAAVPPEAILQQASRDAAFLLRRIDPKRSPPDAMAARNARLVELGHA